MKSNELTTVLGFLTQDGVEVLDAEHGFIRCPGEHLHRNPTRINHCRVFPSPWVHCFHQSCASEVRSLNRKLSLRFHQSKCCRISTGQCKTGYGSLHRRSQIQEEARKSRDYILSKFCWPYAAIAIDSPERVDFGPQDHWYYILNLFSDEDVVWIGRDTYDSGRPLHSRRFRPAFSWMGERLCPGPFICPNIFKPGVCSRSDINVLARKFLVIESDTLNRDSVGAIFRWLQETKGMRLRAVVDTAGKSLHGWFDHPRSELAEELKIALPELECDPAMFKASQPCRLPGAARNGKFQTLIYITK